MFKITYEDYKYMAEFSYPVTVINENWEILCFRSFSNPPTIARVGHRHASNYHIVGHKGSVGCECKVPDEILVLIKLECWELGATLILGETFQPV